ncbi:MAG: DUF4037 domain-containing protein [Corallococcus sp.]|nr:DUF4037 domain-containing protein [Bacillota bacterium]MCM1533330.1 DUF4037 domain-containing protein [Corallococcus sp.]
MPDEIFRKLSELDEVEAIALGGSRAGKFYDEKSDYDVYVYVTQQIDENVRRNILSRYCSYMEIGNDFWEREDNCVLNSGTDIDILYRDLDDFCKGVENVVVNGQAANSYTTCMWHNLLNCKIIFDRCGKLKAAQKRFDVPYPKKLKTAIIDRQLKLLDEALPAYKTQIRKAVSRKDYVSVNHRITEFLASYFDLIFALNEQTHPGEKRLITLCKNNCKILPQNFEENLSALFSHMFCDDTKLLTDVDTIIANVKQIITR